MARKKRKNSTRYSDDSWMPAWASWDIDPDTQRGILSIVLLVLGLVTGFSLFGAAGQIGEFINTILTGAVGIGRYVIPMIFFIIVYTLLYPSEYEIRPMYGIGVLMFSLSIFGMLDIIEPKLGGYIGIMTTYLFREFASLIVAVVVFIAGFIISILILFNTSLDHLAQRIPAGTFFGRVFRFVVTLFSSARHRFATAREQALAEVEAEVDESEDDEAESGGRGLFHKRAARDIDDEEQDDENTAEAVVAEDETDEEGQLELIHLAKQHRKIDLPLDLLSHKKGKPTSGDIEENKRIIQQTLHNFNIDVEMGDVSVGPTVTQYTFKPSKGVKVSQVLSLQNDISLALAAHPIRIEAPIPGKALIGVEVPNHMAARVGLRELLESDSFKKRKSNLTLLFGRDVAGTPYADSLGNMPHLLIAGATGSGKSVCLNIVLLSLLYQNGPDDLKLIMVDPKRVEFTMYNDIPHLLTPVVTDVQKTINALKWCVNEMDRRYEVLSNSKKRDITSYNASHPKATMPFIVFVVDELADLMATAPREVEAAIVRLAQMARAVGIHLILATQRPSVDVITGLIKANITSRCAFNTASLVDSRTILDSSGAEKLLGKGDMLYVSAESSKPKRVQGAFVTEEEIIRVVNYLKSKDHAEYDTEVIGTQVAKGLIGIGTGGGDSSDEDDLLPEAKQVIIRSKKASASLLQRRLRIGYARAARILDILEDEGFIGPANGAKPREILVDEEDIELMEQAKVAERPAARAESRPEPEEIEPEEIEADEIDDSELDDNDDVEEDDAYEQEDDDVNVEDDSDDDSEMETDIEDTADADDEYIESDDDDEEDEKKV